MMALAIIMAAYIVTINFLCPLSHKSKANGIQNASWGQDPMGAPDEAPTGQEPGAWAQILNMMSSKEREIDVKNMIIPGSNYNQTIPDTSTLVNTGNSSMGGLKTERPPIIKWE